MNATVTVHVWALVLAFVVCGVLSGAVAEYLRRRRGR